MKNKLFKKPDAVLDEDESNGAEEAAEVSSSGPSIASLKNSKMLVILASSVLITVVIYFMFFKGSNKPKDNLEEVAPKIMKKMEVAQSDTGQSPYELKKLEEKKQKDENAAALDKPKLPEVPKLPDLPADTAVQDVLIEPEKPKEQPLQAPLPVAPLAQQPLPLPTPLPNQNPAQAQPVQPGQPNQNGQPSGDPKYAPIIVLAGPAGPARSVGYDNNINVLGGNAINKLDKTKIAVKTTFVENRNTVIAQGKMITAVLETAINTEAPGSVRGIVSHDVYGEAGSEVLISRGSRLYGTYSSEVSRGQARVQINWTRLIRPDGVDLAISSFASDQFGRAGIPGEIDNKYGSVVTNSILTSILAVAGVAAAEKALGNNGSTTTTVNPQQGSTTTTGTASTQAVYNVSKTITDVVGKIISDNLNLNPVIRVPQGTKITVIVNADMNIPPMKK